MIFAAIITVNNSDWRTVRFRVFIGWISSVFELKELLFEMRAFNGGIKYAIAMYDVMLQNDSLRIDIGNFIQNCPCTYLTPYKISFDARVPTLRPFHFFLREKNVFSCHFREKNKQNLILILIRD